MNSFAYGWLSGNGETLYVRDDGGTWGVTKEFKEAKRLPSIQACADHYLTKCAFPDDYRKSTTNGFLMYYDSTGKQLTVTPIAIFTRVSSKAQDYQRQISDLTAYAEKQGYLIVEIISEKISATKKKNDERQGVARLLELARSKQISKVLATEVSRIGRRPSEILKLIEELTELKVSLYIGNYGLETLLPSGKSNPAASLIVMVLADVARMETETLSERIVSGQQEAKRKGKKLGRKEGTTKSNEKILKEYSRVVKDLQEGISVRKVSRIHDISTSTTQRIKAAMSETQNV